MSKLVWDNTGERLYETGVNHGVLYPQSNSGTYPAGVVWNGLTGVTESPDGAEPNDLYADNIKYASIRGAETFGGTIEAYTYPEEFAECDGSAAVASGVYIGQQKRKPFGFSYRTEIGNDTSSDVDAGYKLHLVYNATASPSEKAYETINDSPDAITFSWEFDTTPVPASDHKPTSLIVIDSTKADPTKLAALEDILYGTSNSDPRLPLPNEVITLMGTVATYSVVNYLTNVDTDNAATTATSGGTYSAELTAKTGHTITNCIVTMNGVDVTSDVYSSRSISIASVTGPIIITATANANG